MTVSGNDTRTSATFYWSCPFYEGSFFSFSQVITVQKPVLERILCRLSAAEQTRPFVIVPPSYNNITWDGLTFLSKLDIKVSSELQTARMNIEYACVASNDLALIWAYHLVL